MIVWTYATAFRSRIFEFPSQKAIMWLNTLRNVDITGLSKGHISVLLKDIVTRLALLVVLDVLCMLIWPWPNPWSSSQGFWSYESCWKLHCSTSISSIILAWSSKLMVDYDTMGRSLQPVRVIFFYFFFSESYHVISNFAECPYYSMFKGPYFRVGRG